MDRLKKLNGSMIAAIVLSVLLIMSITTGATLAWFASRDSATNSLTMGEAVVVTIGEDYKQGDGTLAMNLPVDKATKGLLPGMSVTPNIKVQLQKSNTNALLRARFITTVEYPDNYIDAAYSNVQKYPDKASEGATTSEGRVLSPTDFPDDHVYAGYIIYDYYNYLGHRLASNMTTEITKAQSDAAAAPAVAADPFSAGNLETTKAAHTKVIHLNRVKVRKSIVDAVNGADDKSKMVTINGIAIKATEKNAAELEIRQRGVDLTNAINRVLQGQRGYKVDPSTGEIFDDNRGIKYTRRVADGWAYRDADQAWYYLGSATNGFVISNNADGKSEEVDKTQPIAQDIVRYVTVKLGNKEVKQPVYAKMNAKTYSYTEGGKTTDNVNNQYYKDPITNGENTNDMNRNYLGGTSKDNAIDRVRNEIGVLNQETIASVDLSEGDVSIDFLTKRFVLPTFIDNSYAKAKVTFTFTVEAVQDYLIDPLQEATAAADRLPNNLVNAILVFNNAFPQSLFPQSDLDEDKLRATGSTANVIPGGGESATWYTTGEGTAGTTKITYNSKNDFELDKYPLPKGKTTWQGDQYAYGFLNNKTLQGEEAYKYGDNENDQIKSLIKGFDTRVDEYGDTVADYTQEAAYQRGTASSIGVCPFKGTTTPPSNPTT